MRQEHDLSAGATVTETLPTPTGFSDETWPPGWDNYEPGAPVAESGAPIPASPEV